MIDKAIISQIVTPKLDADGAYIVELTISTDNRIELVVDHFNGISLEYCIELNRMIEAALNRDVEDFELEVASAGIGQPFKVQKQYLKNIGREVELLTTTGIKAKGTLISADENGFTIEYEEKEAVEGKKRKVLVKKQTTFTYTEVKQVKDIVFFK